MKSIQEQVLQNLDFPCAIVMDNTSYHSTHVDNCLNLNTRKAKIMVCMRLIIQTLWIYLVYLNQNFHF